MELPQTRPSDRFRLIVWDEPGSEKSTPPTTRDYSLENLARDREAVLALAGDKPAILLGHSIGGMITLTFCRLFPSALGSRVMGLVLTLTTQNFVHPMDKRENFEVFFAKSDDGIFLSITMHIPISMR